MMWDSFIAVYFCSSLLMPIVLCQDFLGCRTDEWRCRDGSCISFDGKCDGAVDCADGSDETHPLCRNSPCQDNLFRCAYGACVDGTAPCNGLQECADGSDELLLECRNETRVERGKFVCDNGVRIAVTDMCDGAPDCADGSDETVDVCARMPCDGHLFQCAYGACVDRGAACNQTRECVDNSDESDELCHPTSTRQGADYCTLPPYPANGRYEMRGVKSARPGDRHPAANITVSCDPSYAVDGTNHTVCMHSSGFDYMPKCSRYCELKQHASVTYTCVKGQGEASVRWPCRDREFPGTEVVPKCREPNYRGSPSHMTCKEDGNWDHVAKCAPECGKITPAGKPYVIGGAVVAHGELPWHAGIYKKTSKPYRQMCGGSLATTTTVITAAHCFYDHEKKPADQYVVAVGKVYRPWDDEFDSKYAQKSNVSEIYMPREFRGARNNYQGDIAVLLLETEVVLQTYIRPVCVDFGEELSKLQLRAGNMGKIAGWGLTAANGNPSQVLQVVELPFVTYDQCFDESPPDFQEYITIDKICAGYLNGTSALCEGDSGGGLAFPELEKGVMRYYLRGVVSTAPLNDVKCDPFARTTFTSIIKHVQFINKYINFNA